MIPGIVASGVLGDYVPPFMAFATYRNSGSAQAAGSGDTTVIFDTEFFDIGGLINLGVSTSQAVIPAGGAGTWRFGVSCQCGSSANVSWKVYKNGSVAATVAGPTNGAANIARCASATITVADGDVMTFVLNLSSGSTTISRQTAAPCFWGYRIGAAGVSASVSRSTSLSLSSATAAAFDTEISDTGGFYSAGAPTRLTVPTTGYYRITAAWNYTGSGSINATVNGVAGNASNCAVRVFTNGSANRTDAMDILYKLTAGDYVQFITHASINLTAGSYVATIELVGV